MRHCDNKLIVLATALSVLIIGQGRAQHLEGSDDFKFPGPIDSSRNAEEHAVRQSRHGRPSSLAKSLQRARQISQMDTVEDFLKLVKDIPLTEKEIVLSSMTGSQQRLSLTGRFGGTGQRSNAVAAIPAKCEPTLTAVRIKEEEADPSKIYFPTCTRIKRCGGCCSHNLLTCQPVASETINIEVLVTSINDDEQMSYRGKEIVPLEQHTKCKCDCRIKADQECSEKQVYVPEECRCECLNLEEESKCKLEYSHTKLWDPDQCKCMCRSVHDCSTGLYFDHNTCRCREVPLSRNWFGTRGQTNYRFGQTQKPANTDTVPPVIVPLDASDPRRKPKEDPERK